MDFAVESGFMRAGQHFLSLKKESSRLTSGKGLAFSRDENL